MKKNIVLILLILSVNLKGQDITNRINEIRYMYQKAQNEKEHYTKQVKDITWDSFEYDEEEDRSLKKNITYYYDANEMVMALIHTSIISDYSSYRNDVECYFKNDSLFFVYSIERRCNRTSFNPEQSNETINVTEERIYFDAYENCIRFLKKEAEGTTETIDSICEKKQNIEQDCSKSVNIINEIFSLLKNGPKK